MFQTSHIYHLKKNGAARFALCILLFAFMIFSPLGAETAHAQEIASKIADATLGKLFAGIAEMFFTGGGQLLKLGGWLLDYSIQFSLNITQYTSGVINGGWSVLRDIANITFIFILLYIAIATILRLGTVDTKQALVNVIIIAFLINFSLFFTQIVIDASNILATVFYNNAISITVDQTKTNNLGLILASALGPQSLFDGTAYKELSNTQTGLAFVFGLIAVLLAAFSFFSVAIMFMIRTAYLIILMVLSPLAFAAWILTDFRSYFKKWFDALLHQSFFAPAYLLVISIVLLIILHPQFQSALGQRNLAAGVNAAISGKTQTFGAEDFIPGGGSILNGFSENAGETLSQVAQAGGATGSLTLASGGQASALSVFFAYLLVILLINGALVVAKQLGGATATMGVKWAGKGLGAAMGLTAAVGRRTVGRGFAALSKSENLKEAAAQGGARGFAARLALRGVQAGAKGSLDIRGGVIGKGVGVATGLAGFDLGKAGGKGGFEAIEKKQIERRAELAELVGKTSVTKVEKEKGEEVREKIRRTEEDLVAKQAEFQTLSESGKNLDRQMELSQEEIPALKEAVEKARAELKTASAAAVERGKARKESLAGFYEQKSGEPLMSAAAYRAVADKIRKGKSDEEKFLENLTKKLKENPSFNPPETGGEKK